MEWKDIVYGPVRSRRLGQSLGINLTPVELKTCNFSCGYCRVGVPSKGSATLEELGDFGWTLDNVRSSITKGLEFYAEKQVPVDYITLAGNGEPTLYPWFPEIVNHTIEQKQKYLDRPTAIFTNATRATNRRVQEAFRTLDRVFCKLDAGDEKTFRRINIPLGVTYEEHIKNLLALDDFELSMAVLDNNISNYESFRNEEFLENLRKMRFKRIFVYDIDIPKTTSPRFNKKIDDRSKLEDLAHFLAEQSEREVVVLWDSTTRECNIPLYPQQIN